MATTVDAPATTTPPDEHWYTLPAEQVAEGLHVDVALGLSQAEVECLSANRAIRGSADP